LEEKSVLIQKDEKTILIQKEEKTVLIENGENLIAFGTVRSILFVFGKDY